MRDVKNFGWKLNAGIDFLEFKASEIAAAVALYVTGGMDVDDKALSSFIQEKVVPVVVVANKLN